jgi:hypothetical protein
MGTVLILKRQFRNMEWNHGKLKQGSEAIDQLLLIVYHQKNEIPL